MLYTFLPALLAFALGLRLPDIDLAPLLWRHRSAWTHGPFWAIALPMLPLPWWAVYVAPAALLGISIHLFMDAKPKAWTGAALINAAPLRITLKPWSSFVYIVASALYSAYMFWRLVS